MRNSDRSRSPQKYLEEVRNLYENLPFPARDPQDETKRLGVTPPDVLARINHYCFRGRQRFDSAFRALVAGGGTGDAAIFLAEQLRECGGEVVYLDISAGSMEIAQQRATVRKLNNIEWIHGSILDIPALKLGRFNYINCMGVLHHLENPKLGLRCLEGVLAEHGAIGVMVYGRIGRLGVTVVQNILRELVLAEKSLQAKLEIAKALLKALPPTNPYFRGRPREKILKVLLEDPANLADIFIHPCDHPFSVAELHAMVEDCMLNIACFTSFDGRITRLQYDPLFMTQDQDPILKTRFAQLPAIARQSVAEMMDGNLYLHTAYLVREKAAAASFSDHFLIPLVPTAYASCAITLLRESGPNGLQIELFNGSIITLKAAKVTLMFLEIVDGHRTIAEIFAALKFGKEAIDATCRDLAILSYFDWILLRHPKSNFFPIVGIERKIDRKQLGSKPWRIAFAST